MTEYQSDKARRAELPEMDCLARVRGSAGAVKGLGPARAAGGAVLRLDWTWYSHLSCVMAVWTTWYLAARWVMAWCSLCTAATMSSAERREEPEERDSKCCSEFCIACL